MLTSIPSPPLEWSTFSLGPLTIHLYALCIMAGIVVAIWLTGKRWVARGGDRDTVIDISIWAVPFGIVGGRIYHVFSSPEKYFGPQGNPIDALKIWEGGLGIWGAVALGVVGAYIGARKAQVSLPDFLDAVAPGLVLAQAIGRLGNYFNHELFGAPTTLPWGLEVDPAIVERMGYEAGTLFHPTFLYELLWNVGVALALIYLDKKFRFYGGRLFVLYIMFYTVGRVWIEMLRIDDAEHIFGVRLNVWTSIIVFLFALAAFRLIGKKQAKSGEVPAREVLAHLDRKVPQPAAE